jgi:ATP-dependent protease ClpP protease subunit
MNFLLSLLVIVGLALPGQALTEKSNKPNLIVLSKKNTVTLRGVVDRESVTILERHLLDMSRNLKDSDVIYMVLDTPGGSVDAGLELIDFIHGLPQKVQTITIFAASMGFQIVQNLDKRWILPNGVIMSHRARLAGVEGEINGNLISRIIHITQIINKLDKIASDRMHMSMSDYQSAIANELWMNGDKAIAIHGVDAATLVRCDSSFGGSAMVKLASMFGLNVTGLMSNCPLISGVTDLQVSEGGSKEERAKATEFGRQYAHDKREIVENYILKGEFLGL